MGAVVEDALDPNLAAAVREELDAENFPIVDLRRHGQRDRARSVSSASGGSPGSSERARSSCCDGAAGSDVTDAPCSRRARPSRRPNAASPSSTCQRISKACANLERYRRRRGAARANRSDPLEAGLFAHGRGGDVAAQPPPRTLHREGRRDARQAGTGINRHDSLCDTVDAARLVGLFESSFGRTLAPGFFDEAPLVGLSRRRIPRRRCGRSGKIAPYLTEIRRRPRRTGRRHGPRSLGSRRQGPPFPVLARTSGKPDRRLVRRDL